MFKNVDVSRGIPEIEPNELKAALGKVAVIDVRTDEEFDGELGHVQGATLFPFDTFPEALGELSAEDPIVFVCRSGNQSGHVTQYAVQKGFKQVYNMKGGMLLWNELGLETE